jgi:hypothetical protein
MSVIAREGSVRSMERDFRILPRAGCDLALPKAGGFDACLSKMMVDL